MDGELNSREKRFVAAFVDCGNATLAAIRAGYSPSGAGRSASRIRKRPRVREAIAKALAEGEADRVSPRFAPVVTAPITSERVLQELGRIAFSDPRQLLCWRDGQVTIRDSAEMTPELAASIAQISITGSSVRVRFHGKEAALTHLVRYFGLQAGQAEAPYDLSKLSDEELKVLRSLTDKLESS